MRNSGASLIIIWRRTSRPHTATTALVNEAYLRLPANQSKLAETAPTSSLWAARAMRQILVNYAKSYRAQKRGGRPDQGRVGRSSNCLRRNNQRQCLICHEALERLGTLGLEKSPGGGAQNILVDSIMARIAEV